MDYLLSRESYARLSSNHSLKLGRSYECAELTYSFYSPRGKDEVQTRTEMEIAQLNC